MFKGFLNPDRIDQLFRDQKTQLAIKAALEPASLAVFLKAWCIALFMVGTFLLTVRVALTVPLFE